MATQPATGNSTYTVQPIDFAKWTPLLGKLEAENPISFRAELDGLSKLTWIIDDGTPVQTGELVAQFDPSEWEEKKLTLERDLEIAQAELRSLQGATHPLEMQRLQRELGNLQSELGEEETLAKDTQELVNERLLGANEMDRHRLKIENLSADIQALQTKIDLTQRILHPAIEQKAQARVMAATTALKRVNALLEKTKVFAPTEGTIHLPLVNIDSEFRQLRVGDGLYKNQIFLQLADLTHLVIQSDVGEASLPDVAPGLNAIVHFPALPGKEFTAVISKVGTHPRGTPQRYPVTLELVAQDPALRPGLTAEIEVLAYLVENSLSIPRRYVRYQNGVASVHIRQGSKERWQPIDIADGNAEMLLISKGVKQGDLLLAP
ncbi:efflux RND transporter periplasmic adaptor subunit [Kiritimatiellota bacterium B12222]|nr:efflux RND transporter periplasmic adaptor subunit [Kiritimatiellota bacterium B12222]